MHDELGAAGPGRTSVVAGRLLCVTTHHQDEGHGGLLALNGREGGTAYAHQTTATCHTINVTDRYCLIVFNILCTRTYACVSL
jgi:hypothetical protein